MESEAGGESSKALQARERRARFVCKGCQRRRRLNKITGYCPLCTSIRSENKDKASSSLSSITGHWSAAPGRELRPTARVNPQPVEQQALLSNFLEAHFPLAGQLEADLTRKVSYLTLLPSRDLSSPILSSAIKSLCLAHFGSQGNNRQLLQASQTFYGQVLGSLQHAFKTRSNALAANSRDVLSTIMLISLYDDSTPAGQRTNANWITHFSGALRFIEAVGPSCLDMRQLFDTRILQNLRMPALMLSIAQRKAFVFAEPAWRDLTSPYLVGVGPTKWWPVLTPLPGLLERADRLANTASQSQNDWALLEVCCELEALKNTLLQFLEEDCAGIYKSPMAPAGAGLTQVNVADPTKWDVNIDEQCFISTDTSRTFLRFHDFGGGTGQAIRCSLSWMSCLIVGCTQLQLMSRFPAMSEHLPIAWADVENQAFRNAQDICRCVFNFSQLKSAAYGDFLLLLLQVVKAFFEQSDSVNEVSWCQRCMIATYTRFMRLKRTSHPTLCRVRDLAPLLAEAVRYREQSDARLYEIESTTQSTPFGPERPLSRTSVGLCPESSLALR